MQASSTSRESRSPDSLSAAQGADEVATAWLNEFPHSDWEIAVFSFFPHYLWSCEAVTYPAPQQGGRRCADVMLSHWRLRFPAPAELGLALLSGMEKKHQRGEKNMHEDRTVCILLSKWCRYRFCLTRILKETDRNYHTILLNVFEEVKTCGGSGGELWEA